LVVFSEPNHSSSEFIFLSDSIVIGADEQKKRKAEKNINSTPSYFESGEMVQNDRCQMQFEWFVLKNLYVKFA
jgi:hypothetical protein